MFTRLVTRRFFVGLGVCLLLGISTTALAVDTFYAASGSNGVAGTLYTLNPATGAATPVGLLRDAAGAPYSMTGMAFHPITGVLYGSTSNQSPTNAGFLVTINPATAIVTSVGDLGAALTGTAADITFLPNGTMYGWESAGTHHLLTINPATGLATTIGAGVGAGIFGGGGLAARPSDTTLFSTPDGSQGKTLRIVDKVTGLFSSTVGTLSPLPVGFGNGAVTGMDFDSTGALYGILSDRGGVANTRLVRINTSTAALTDIGASATDLDAFAILVPEPSGLVVLAGVAGLALRRARKIV